MRLKRPMRYNARGVGAVATTSTGYAQHVYNEPSRGLYFCKKHMARAVPRLVRIGASVAAEEGEIEAALDDLSMGASFVDSIANKGPKAFSRMEKTLNQLIRNLSSRVDVRPVASPARTPAARSPARSARPSVLFPVAATGGGGQQDTVGAASGAHVAASAADSVPDHLVGG